MSLSTRARRFGLSFRSKVRPGSPALDEDVGEEEQVKIFSCKKKKRIKVQEETIPEKGQAIVAPNEAQAPAEAEEGKNNADEDTNIKANQDVVLQALMMEEQARQESEKKKETNPIEDRLAEILENQRVIKQKLEQLEQIQLNKYNNNKKRKATGCVPPLPPPENENENDANDKLQLQQQQRAPPSGEMCQRIALYHYDPYKPADVISNKVIYEEYTLLENLFLEGKFECNRWHNRNTIRPALKGTAFTSQFWTHMRWGRRVPPLAIDSTNEQLPGIVCKYDNDKQFYVRFNNMNDDDNDENTDDEATIDKMPTQAAAAE